VSTKVKVQAGAARVILRMEPCSQDNTDQHQVVQALRRLALTPARVPSENTTSRLNQSLLKMAQEQNV
jgi:hypothetical protein